MKEKFHLYLWSLIIFIFLFILITYIPNEKIQSAMIVSLFIAGITYIINKNNKK